MKQFYITFLLTVLMSMVGAKTFAYDAKVDGIYYNFRGTEAVVTYERYNSGYYGSDYTGNIAIPETVTHNGMTYSVTKIAWNAFQNCKGLTSVTIPNSVTDIGNEAFKGCTALTSVTIPNSVTSIGEEAFNNTAWYNNQPEGLVYAGKVAYKYKGTMPANTSVVLEEGTLGIAGGAFYQCSNLTSVKIPNSVTSFGNHAFYSCTGLTSMTIGNSVTSIGNSTFEGCTGLTSVTIGNSVTSIGGRTFYGCTGLTSVTIPNSATSVGTWAFYGCGGLTSVTIGNSVTNIGYQAFAYCTCLTSVIIPNSVTTILDYAFEGCISLASVTIGNSVTNIAWNAFQSVHPDKVIWLPNTPPSGYRDFAGKVNYVMNDLYTSIDNKTVYPFLSSMFEVDGVKYVPVSPSERTCDAIDCIYNESIKEIRLGKTVSYRGVEMTVKNIGPYFCSGNPFVENLVLDLTNEHNIDKYAFSECGGLKKVIVKDIAAWCNINFKDSYSNPLYYAHHLYSDENTEISNLVIPNNVSSINWGVFYGCTGLTSVAIPNSVTSIGGSAFYGCTGLTSVTIPNSVTSIGSYTFQDCTGLTSVTIPNSVTSIDHYAFYGCTGLTSVDIQCKEIGSCFSGLPIKKITFGEEVESIGAKAFSGCTAVTKIISMAKTPPACGTQALDDINKWDCVLSVPQGTLSAYQAADQWKEFFFIDENATGIGSLTTDPSLKGDGSYYTIDGRKLQGVPTQKGVYIVNGHTVVIK